MLQKNPYNKNCFKNALKTKLLAQKVYQEFGSVYLDFEPTWYADETKRPMDRAYSYTQSYRQDHTLRENLIISKENRLFNFTIFYYIEKIMEHHPITVLDIGCGHNYFQKIYSNIVGLSPEEFDVEADIRVPFDNNFSSNNVEKYSSAMAICSLHFVPITKFSERLLSLSRVIKPGGRGLITFNICQMIARTSEKTLDKLFAGRPTPSALAKYFDNEIDKLGFNWIVVDNIIEHNEIDNINGNLRLVFEKRK